MLCTMKKHQDWDQALVLLQQAWQELAKNTNYNAQLCPVEISILTYFVLAQISWLAADYAKVYHHTNHTTATPHHAS